MKKSLRAIAVDVPAIFTDECIGKLATIAKLPAYADLGRFAKGVRVAACIFARDRRIPDDNELNDEIGKLLSAAEGRRFEQAATLLGSISTRAHDHLKKRGALPSRGVALPSSDALLDAAQRDRACETIVSLCHCGGVYIQGRRRPSGKRSRTWRWSLHAPKKQKHPAKREVERALVMHLQLAYLEAVGRPPANTAHHTHPGPFARMVKECLHLVGASDANAIELINELHQSRRNRY